jgi:hypothetical protein
MMSWRRKVTFSQPVRLPDGSVTDVRQRGVKVGEIRGVADSAVAGFVHWAVHLDSGGVYNVQSYEDARNTARMVL